MARTNRITATISPEEKAVILASIEGVKNLMPYLINLTTAERKNLRGIGNKNFTYAQKCLEAALAFPAEMKASFDINEFQKDINLYNNLLAIQIACQSLLEKVDDSMQAAGIDTMSAASEVYNALKSSAKSNANVKTIVDEIAVHFKKQGVKKTTPTTPIV